MIQFACPSCNKHYKVADEMAGKKGKCKECGQIMMIPELPTASQSSIEAAPPEDPTPNPAFGTNDPSRLSATASSGGVFDAPTQAPGMDAGSDPFGASEVGQVPDGQTGSDPFFADSPLPSGGQFPAGSVPTSAVRNVGDGPLTGESSDLKFEITQRPDFSLLKVEIDTGKKVFAEPSAMVSMSPSIHLEAGFKGGLGKTFGRMLGGESLIINTFTAQSGPGEVLFAGGMAGDVAYYRLEGRPIMLQRGAYMLNGPGVEVTGKWQGAKGFFGGEGLVLLKATGAGDLFFNSYGAILEVDVTDDFIVDTGYIVAFEESLDYRVTVLPGLRKGGKIKSFFFGGEGLVCQFSGQGRVWVQTRQVSSFLSWVNAFRPTKSN
ncbi:TIGR00266 family protein [Roseiconus lacunae]|uniref:TIGR00266 family protein n=1 Tax=Roseiconus lacunae TaxID=2605694 RepID=A0ABT7PKI3_9BACT|nr:TIGR00266 family protein [Roseiconus lacunae]MDM4016819.1 TIGR00266 family protein [Roseiconus lacunae]WRQ50868.1 TIGR00266 family protein [Stieleria sp. HD01]